MIEIEMAHTDRAQMRFAHSPIRELVASLRVLHDRSRHHMYSTWLSALRVRLGGLRLVEGEGTSVTKGKGRGKRRWRQRS